MSMLSLDASGLRTQAVEYACPSASRNLQALISSHGLWTGAKASGAIYSGYRRQVLSREGLSESLALAKTLRARFKTLVVLGIGGSALGARTALSALGPLVKPSESRRVLVLDNLDPVDFLHQVSDLDLKDTAVAVISKAGGTIETLSQASWFIARFREKGLALKDHLVTITDPSTGALRAWTKREGLNSAAVPADTGGRFSVFTPVGMIPLAFAGLDAEALLEGAVQQFHTSLEPIADLAARLAELERGGYVGHVLFPYSTVLKDFGAWFVQLWGESLGKPSRAGLRGALPTAAVGATDQHSLLQRLVEGPDNLVTGFLGVKTWPSYRGLPAPKMEKLPPEISSLAFAEGKTFAEILEGERKATASVLKTQGRPVYELTLSELNASALGALFAFYMDLTTLTGAASEVNPFDQPGVEHGKKILPGILSGKS